jgi:hypothetical protein
VLVTPGVKRIVNTAFLAWLREVRFDHGGGSHYRLLAGPRYCLANPRSVDVCLLLGWHINLLLDKLVV